MKYWIFIIILSLSVPPLQAGPCAMDGEESPHSSHSMDHSSMDSGGPSGHDCCDSDQPSQEPGCDGSHSCSPCSVSASVLPDIARVPVGLVQKHHPAGFSGVTLSRHTAPPFRPPIS